MVVPLDRIQSEARRTAGWVTTALGFTIPIWVVADSILLVVLVTCWAASGEWREKVRRVASNPVAVAALLLFAWLLLGSLWGGGSLEERSLAVKKYTDLLLIPLLISLVIDVRERNRAMLAFAVSLVVTLVLSLALSAGMLPTGGVIKGDPTNPFVFKKYLTHNILMAFGALLFAALAWRSYDKRVQWGWGFLSLLAVVDVLMVQGRTGYLILAGLTLLTLHRLLGWRGVAAATMLLAIAFTGAYQISTSFHNRVSLTTSTLTEWNPQTADPSIRERVEFYQNTVELIQEHPVIGVGTGGFIQAYAEQAKQTGVPVTSNPHNQYLMIMVQVGVIGLGLFLWLFVMQWRVCPTGGDQTYGLLARGLVLTMVIGCIFNSLLVDHTEKLLYCWFSGLMYSGADSRSEPVA